MNLITIVLAVEGNPHTWEIIQSLNIFLHGVNIRAFDDSNSWSTIFFPAIKGNNGTIQTRVVTQDNQILFVLYDN